MSEYPSRKELFVITSADEIDNSIHKNRTREFNFNSSDCYELECNL